MPGTYTVRISHGDQTVTGSVNVQLDPRIDVPEEKLQARETLLRHVLALTQTAADAVKRLRDAQQTIGTINSRLRGQKSEEAKEVRKQGKALQDSIKALLARMVPKEVQGIRPDPSLVTAKISAAQRHLESAWDAYGEPAQLLVRQAELSLAAALEDINTFFDRDWAAYRRAVDALNLSFFEEYVPLKPPQGQP